LGTRRVAQASQRSRTCIAAHSVCRRRGWRRDPPPSRSSAPAGRLRAALELRPAVRAAAAAHEWRRVVVGRAAALRAAARLPSRRASCFTALRPRLPPTQQPTKHHTKHHTTNHAQRRRARRRHRRQPARRRTGRRTATARASHAEPVWNGPAAASLWSPRRAATAVWGWRLRSASRRGLPAAPWGCGDPRWRGLWQLWVTPAPGVRRLAAAAGGGRVRGGGDGDARECGRPLVRAAVVRLRVGVELELAACVYNLL